MERGLGDDDLVVDSILPRHVPTLFFPSDAGLGPMNLLLSLRLYDRLPNSGSGETLRITSVCIIILCQIK